VCGLEAYKENQAGSVYVELKIYMPNEFFHSVTKFIFWIKNNLSYIGDCHRVISLPPGYFTATGLFHCHRIISLPPGYNPIAVNKYYYIKDRQNLFSRIMFRTFTKIHFFMKRIIKSNITYRGILHCSTILIQTDGSKNYLQQN
jgi:hypothetical protein